MVRRFLQRLQVLAWLALLAACGGGGESSSSCSPAPTISSSPPTTATVGVQYAYWTHASIACIPFLMDCTGVELVQGPPGAGVDQIRDLIYWTPTQADARAQVPFTIVTHADLCGKRASQSWVVSVAPVSPIHAFQASSVFVMPGDTVSVTGVFEGSGSIPGVGAVTSGVPVTIGPINGETMVRLDVRDSTGQTWSESVTIRLLTPPVITTWKAEPSTIGVNAATTLSWWVDGQVDTVRIDPGGRLVAWNSALTVSPSSTTTYVLTATNRAATVTRSLEVVVLPPSSIDEFSASASSTNVGGSVTLSARFFGSGEILKENDRGGMDSFATIRSGESVSSGPLNRSTRFTLRVSGGTTVTQDLSIAVTGPGTFELLPSLDFVPQGAVVVADGRAFITAQDYGWFFDPVNNLFTRGNRLPNAWLTRLLVQFANGSLEFVNVPGDIGLGGVDLYDYNTGGYFDLGTLQGLPRQALALADNRLLVRVDAAHAYPAGIVVYRPARNVNGTVTARPSLVGSTAARLADGRVLFIKPGGGAGEIFTPGPDTFSSSRAFFAARGGFFATVLLPDGKLLVSGGQVSAGTPPELYDPATDIIAYGPGQPTPNLAAQALAVLANGKVLVAGGSGYASALLFDPATRSFTETGALRIPRTDALAVTLQDGRVLVIGGCGYLPCPAELYTP